MVTRTIQLGLVGIATALFSVGCGCTPDTPEGFVLASRIRGNLESPQPGEGYMRNAFRSTFNENLSSGDATVLTDEDSKILAIEVRSPELTYQLHWCFQEKPDGSFYITEWAYIPTDTDLSQHTRGDDPPMPSMSVLSYALYFDGESSIEFYDAISQKNHVLPARADQE